MHKLIDFVCEELDEIEEKADKGKLSLSDVQYADTLAHLKKNLLKSEEMMEDFDEGYSSEMRPMDGMSYGRGGNRGNRGGSSNRGGSYEGGSYARGRGSNARRDSMGRYSREGGYSRDAAEMTAELREMMDDPKYSPVRSDIERLMRKVESM